MNRKMNSFQTYCFVMLCTSLLIGVASSSCNCSLRITDVEYTRRYRHHLRTNLLHPNVCVASMDPVLHPILETTNADLEPCCCQGYWRRVQLMLDDDESFMPTAYYCQQVTCPNQSS